MRCLSCQTHGDPGSLVGLARLNGGTGQAQWWNWPGSVVGLADSLVVDWDWLPWQAASATVFWETLVTCAHVSVSSGATGLLTTVFWETFGHLWPRQCVLWRHWSSHLSGAIGLPTCLALLVFPPVWRCWSSHLSGAIGLPTCLAPCLSWSSHLSGAIGLPTYLALLVFPPVWRQWSSHLSGAIGLPTCLAPMVFPPVWRYWSSHLSGAISLPTWLPWEFSGRSPIVCCYLLVASRPSDS